MTPDQARNLTSACVKSAMSVILGDDYVPLPTEVSLADLLEANRLVSEMGPTDNGDGTRTLHCHVDDRLVAALYALDHYERDPVQLLEAVGFQVRSTE